jgi:bifunctional DNA-binding transcriptional regulator/antitoxin component of YhaV-PrlF toxin-antitoxin module
MSQNLLVERGRKITLPNEVIDHYGLKEDTPLRIIETRNGILLVPLTDEPMTESLRVEIEQWQALGVESVQIFPYEDDGK